MFPWAGRAAAFRRALGRYDAAGSPDVFILMPNHLHGIVSLSDPAAEIGADIGRGEEAGGSTRCEGDTILPASSPKPTMPTNPKGEEAVKGVSPADETVSAASSPKPTTPTNPEGEEVAKGVLPADEMVAAASSPLRDGGENGPGARHATRFSGGDYPDLQG